jgi:hypothetical protein
MKQEDIVYTLDEILPRPECAKNFRWCRWGADGGSSVRRPGSEDPIGASGNSSKLILYSKLSSKSSKLITKAFRLVVDIVTALQDFIHLTCIPPVTLGF